MEKISAVMWKSVDDFAWQRAYTRMMKWDILEVGLGVEFISR